jgi:hypothetical protein
VASESAVREKIAAINQKIRAANFTTGWGPPSTLLPLDAEQVVEQWRSRRQR